jgi:hypothetical protein
MADNDWAHDLHQERLGAMEVDDALGHPNRDTSSYVDADLIYQDLSLGVPTKSVVAQLRTSRGKKHSQQDWLSRTPSRPDRGVVPAYLRHLRNDLHLQIWDFRGARNDDPDLDVGVIAETVRKDHLGSPTPVHHIPSYSPTPLSFGPFGPPALLSSNEDAPFSSDPDDVHGKVQLAILDTGLPPGYDKLHPRLIGAVEQNPDPEDPYIKEDCLRLDAGHGLFILDVFHHLAPRIRPVYMRRPARTDSNLSLSDHLIALDLWDVANHARDAKCGLIVNMSFAAYTTGDRPGLGLLRELAWLADHGSDVLVVAAAGNGGDNRKTFPAACDLPNVVSVGALDGSGHVAPFSSRGSWVDCWTTGAGVGAGYVDGVYDHPSGYNVRFSAPDPCATWSGTSFAAPRVAAAIARKAATMPKVSLLTAWEALRKENRDRHPHWSDSSERFYTEHGVIIDI